MLCISAKTTNWLQEVLVALRFRPGRLVLNATANATRHACLVMPDAEGLAFNDSPPWACMLKSNLLSLYSS